MAACSAAALAISVPAGAQPSDTCSTNQLGLHVDGSRFLLRHQACSAPDQPEPERPAPRGPLLNSDLLQRLLELKPLVQREWSHQNEPRPTVFRQDAAGMACLAFAPACFTAREWASYCEHNPQVAFHQARSCADARRQLAMAERLLSVQR